MFFNLDFIQSVVSRSESALQLFIAILILGCAVMPDASPVMAEPLHDKAKDQQAETVPLSVGSVSVKILVDNGGRVAWYQGKSHELIAYDAISNTETRDTELYVIRPDGTGNICVTCNSDIPKGFVGQPEWHPNGEYLIIQIENPNSEHRSFNHMSFGFDNDLWIIRKNGSGAEKIWTSEKNHAALHPHFDHTGTKLIFSERTPTGKSRFFLRGRTPGGENHWDGWRIHIADFDLSRKGGEKLSNHRTFQPNRSGFYETHGFAPDGRILYSFTAGGKPYVDDIYSVQPDGNKSKNLINEQDTWDEHGLYSPNGEYFAFMSSRVDRNLRFPKSRPRALISELYIRRGEEKAVQISEFNKRKGQKVVVSDFDWDRSGKRIVMQVASLTSREPPELWILTLP